MFERFRMNHHIWKYLIFSSLLFLLFSPLAISSVQAQNRLVLLGEQHWDTYGSGGTCDHGSNDLAIADVDGDGVNEIVTGGFTYGEVNGSETPFQAPLTAYSWNGENFTLKQNLKWPGTIEVVYAADVDGDGKKEILTGGLFRNDSGTFSSLRVWRWSSSGFSLVTNYEGISVSAISVSDINKDGVQEILATGNEGKPQTPNMLFLWHLQNNALILDNEWTLSVFNVGGANSIYVADLAKDGQTEIVTAGYSGNLNASKGQLCIWSLSGNSLTIKANSEWQMVSSGYAPNIAGGVLGNTVVNSMKVGDLNGDGIPEVVTGGFTYDGSKAEGQLRVWGWDGTNLSLKSSKEWVDDDITTVLSVSIGDVDGDSKTEIVAGGMLAPYGSFNTNATKTDRGQLGVWGWDGSNLAIKENQNWEYAEGVSVWNVGSSDFNNDGKVEIVSCGCISYERMCDPDMRIWLVESSASSFPTLPVAVSAIVGAVAVSTVVFVLVKKRLKK